MRGGLEVSLSIFVTKFSLLGQNISVFAQNVFDFVLGWKVLLS